MENVLSKKNIKKDNMGLSFDLNTQNYDFENFEFFNPKMVLLEESKEDTPPKSKRVYITGMRFIFEDGSWEF